MISTAEKAYCDTLRIYVSILSDRSVLIPCEEKKGRLYWPGYRRSWQLPGSLVRMAPAVTQLNELNFTRQPGGQSGCQHGGGDPTYTNLLTNKRSPGPVHRPGNVGT